MGENLCDVLLCSLRVAQQRHQMRNHSDILKTTNSFQKSSFCQTELAEHASTILKSQENWLFLFLHRLQSHLAGVEPCSLHIFYPRKSKHARPIKLQNTVGQTHPQTRCDKLSRALIWCFTRITHTLIMGDKERNSYDAAFKLNAIDLAVREGKRAAAR